MADDKIRCTRRIPATSTTRAGASSIAPHPTKVNSPASAHLNPADPSSDQWRPCALLACHTADFRRQTHWIALSGWRIAVKRFGAGDALELALTQQALLAQQ